MLKCNIDQTWEPSRVPILLLNKLMNNGSNADIRKKEILNPEELALYLGISKATVYRLIESRQIPFAKIGGSLRVKKTEIDEYWKVCSFEPFNKQIYERKKTIR
jgi:excisionase family DNA binding protein